MKQIILDFPMPITTPRLLIRPVKIGDGTMFNEAIIESFDNLHRFMDWAKEKPSVEESEAYASLAAANWIFKKQEEPWLPLCIIDKDTKQLIGGIGFHHYVWEVPSVETGYWIRTSRAQQGLMTEAVNAITQYVFRQLGVKRITITCDRDNTRSKKIPERLGYVLEAILKNHRRKPVSGELSDTLVYARYDCEKIPELEVTWEHS